VTPTQTEQQDRRRVKLTLHYDGAGFFGWQAQPDARTVQGELEAALERLTQTRGSVIAAGRTDRGVHATGQVVGVAVPERWTPAELRRALNAVLPADVWVVRAESVPWSFHARYDAIARAYVYRVGVREAARSPFLRRWCWPLGRALAPAALEEAASRFRGEHSFRAFAKSGQPERGELCTVERAEWRPWRSLGWELHVTANRFLHHMVRYMVGTMVDIALGRRPVDDVDRLLAGEGGVETSVPAPPEGLFLSRVLYARDELESETADEVLSG
jgi:tRNA pseudouridine38-40 synthase